MNTQNDCLSPLVPGIARQIIAVVKSATFSHPKPGDRVHLSTTYRDGNKVSQELSYAEYEQQIKAIKGVLGYCPIMVADRILPKKTLVLINYNQGF